ncbi:MAG: hypothetical protein GF311_25100 [Candidatus Lokiarchaeota archaeon]|nr:hypothetical protein [Candidatus Lokiarchaeota archaeon]
MSDTQEVYQALMDLGFTEEDLEEEVRQKESKFHGFITKQGALFLIAKENGIQIRAEDVDPEAYAEAEQEVDYNEFIVPIEDLDKQMTNIVLLGKVTRIFPVNEFVRKDGTAGKVGSFLVTDASGTTKVVLWGEQVKIMESEFFQVGTTIRCINGYAKIGLKELLEVHFSKKSKLLLDPQDISKKMRSKLEQIPIPKGAGMNTLSKNTGEYEGYKGDEKLEVKDLFTKEGFIASLSGIITIGGLKEFTKDNGDKSFLLKLLLTDRTGEITVNIWGMSAIEILKMVENGMSVQLKNVFIEENEYSKSKEITFNKKSVIKFI